MDLTDLARQLRDELSGRVETDLALARFTTYRVGGPAALYVEPEHAGDLSALGGVLESSGLGGGRLPVLPLGRGSNLVVSDAGFPGIVIRLGNSFSAIESAAASPGAPGARAGAAATLPQLANWAARRSLTGSEWAISIPGSVGGGVRMNAGAHGGEIADILHSALVCDLTTFAVTTRSVSELGMSYRRSNLSENDLVLEGTFAFTKGDEAAIKDRMEQYRQHRAATQPGALQNAGSVFKNPDGDSAGRLVEACGLKGLRVGNAEVSELHANFFIARDGAKAQDVFDLVHEVRRRVRDRFEIELHPEIRFVGPFDGFENGAGS